MKYSNMAISNVSAGITECSVSFKCSWGITGTFLKVSKLLFFLYDSLWAHGHVVQSILGSREV